ncbi:MAG: hypothetical protein H6772_04330 [Pseudomonadales bacterium]|nr:hypothetical protein [Pseudomonadales bacterium]
MQRKSRQSLIVLFLLGLIFLSTPINSIQAQTPTSQNSNQQKNQDSVESTSSSTTSESIQDIKKIIKENIENSKVKGAIDNLINRKIAIIGEVSRITDETITIKNRLGTRILALDENPKILKGNEEIDINNIEVENWIMVLGRLKDDNFSPSIIKVFSSTLRPKNQEIMIGIITSVSKTEVAILPRSGDSEKIFLISKESKFQDSNGESVLLGNFTKDINVLVTGYNNEKDSTLLTLRSLAPLSDE